MNSIATERQLNKQNISNVIFSRRRKDKIVNLITDGTAFSRNQIQSLFFKMKTGKRKSQEVLNDLAMNDKRLKRYHKDHYISAVYYINKCPLDLLHVLAINDVYCEIMNQKKSWMTIEWDWTYSINNGLVVADAMITVYWQPDRKQRQVIFLEVERDLRKRFDKDIQYTKIYESNDWYKPPFPDWVVVDENSKKVIFPTILIVTDHPPELNNKSNLRFVVATPDQVKQDIFSLIKR